MVIIRRGLRFLGWKRGDRGGSGRKGHVLLITYSWMTRALQTFTILFPAQGLLKDTSEESRFGGPTVLLGCFELYGSQDRKNGVTWYFGTWMRLRIESYVHAAKCQFLLLVSLNQLQTRGLELVKVFSFFFMATQTCNISIVGNTHGLLMVLKRNEKSWCVSCKITRSDLQVSLQHVALNIGSDFSTSLWEVAPGSNLCVSGRENASDFVRWLWESRFRMWCTATSCSRSGKSLQAVLVQRSL
ncbi:hypothetical protein F2Q69_00017035 [Brassica cretica]|uniref:Uncharacterized protein n=1 Tax=Brassica cretica TaxID=69181 RepID=A0A8S9R954_BRACR|nr:hypothetical protein F2Q69_00017035 [Brassica cretica]